MPSSSTFTALQSAIWDTVNNPGVISNSFHDAQSMSPDSPFYQAYWQLYIDAALRNQTCVLRALGDGGSGNQTGNGLANVQNSLTSPYAVTVGGTSPRPCRLRRLTRRWLHSVVAPALAGDRATIWQLGLRRIDQRCGALQSFVETAWNTYKVTGNTIGTSSEFPGGYLHDNATSGGVESIPADASA